MDLKFIWIKAYKNINDIGFNFQNEANESFEYKNEELRISKNESHLPENFFNSSIRSVTAIVGKNGSGKTNLSEFINLNLANFYNGGLAKWLDGKVEAIYVIGNLIAAQNNIAIQNEKELEKAGFEILRYDESPFDENMYQYNEKGLLNTTYLYYATIFDQRQSWNLQNLTDISTNYLLAHDKYDDASYFKEFERGFGLYEHSINEVRAFFQKERLREADFLLDTEIELPLKKLTAFYLRLDHSRENRFLSLFNDSDEEIKKAFTEYNQWERTITTDTHPKRTEKSHFGLINAKDVQQAFVGLFLLNIIKALTNNHWAGNKKIPIEFSYDFIFSEDYEAVGFQFEQKEKLLRIKTLVNQLAQRGFWADEDLDYYDAYYRSYDLEGKIYQAVSELQLDLSNSVIESNLKELLKLITELLSGVRIIHYGFIYSLSSGEKSLLSFYSRFYYAFKKIKADDEIRPEEKKEHIKIFIDEGESTLHPSWQREFFNRVIPFIDKLFSGRKIQLILTTHSPFILSDIPKSNIIFLDRDSDGNCKLVSYEREQTFGANIHTLLADSFFMTEGLMGVFSKEKIQETIDWLLETQANPPVIVDQKQVAYYRSIIDLIAEPVLKEKLSQMLDEVIGISEIDEQLSYHNRQIEYLNKLKKKENDKDKKG